MPDPRALLDGMNAPQQQAVEHPGGPLLILAGAGSGKTRVLTHRIAFQLATGKVRAHQVLAITFTNKAAAEMRTRVRALTGDDGQRLWVMTFHATCARILRTDGEHVGYTSGFSIYDQADSRRLIKRLLGAREDGDTAGENDSPRSIHARISDAKNRLISPEDWLAQQGDSVENRSIVDLWGRYDRELKRMNALDFDDLLLATIRLLDQHPDVRAKYHRRFQQILVDEYQDTNQAQYRLLQLLLADHRNLTVVGDPDQSVYRFRSADIRNILNFEREFTDATTIKLEQNYRSTQTILDAANAVIAHNASRKPKRLWTDHGPGAVIQVHELSDGDHEADHISQLVQQHIAGGRSFADIAVLYRTNAQSRTLENALKRDGIPYQITGGLRFYDRAEIKDALAYLRLIANPRDDDALTRIINTPKRGIGPATVNHLQVAATGSGRPLLETARVLTRGISQTRPNYSGVVNTFLDLVDQLNEQAQQQAAVAPVLDHVLRVTGLLPHPNPDDEQLAARRDNLLELLNDAAAYDAQHPGAGSLTGFLEQTSLITDADQIDAGDQITLMTLHASKGLEYPIVMLVGFEEHLFPHDRALQEGADAVEEERRLCYVGITRAQQQLHLSYARQRSIFGRTEDAHPSRFLLEIPDLLYQHHSYETTDSVHANRFHPEHPSPILKLDRQPANTRDEQVDRHPEPPATVKDTPTETPAPAPEVLVEATPVVTATPEPQAVELEEPAAAAEPASPSTVDPGDGGYQAGDPITHPDLGPGTVTQVDGKILTLAFERSPGRTFEMHASRAPLQRAA